MNPTREHLHPARRIGLVAGPLLAAVAYWLAPSSYLVVGPDGVESAVALTGAGRATVGLLVWMAVWWLTEATEISATALLPLVVLPLATVGGEPGMSAKGAMTAAAAPYAHPMIGLFLGGFVVALSMERWGLHRRIALRALVLVGTSQRAMVGGAMLVTAGLSMWVSNTATAVMMTPIALSIAQVAARAGGDVPGADAPSSGDRFTRCILLSVAYSASIGGIATLIGTPPNAIMAAFARQNLGVEIGFGQWMLVGVPLVVVMLPLTWVLLTRVVEPLDRAPIAGGRAAIRGELDGLGRTGPGEWVTLVVFVAMAGAWILRKPIAAATFGGVTPFAGLTDTGIAIAGALALFVIPVDRRASRCAMDWETAKRVPWGILILFGGGLSLASAVQQHGVGEMLAAYSGGLGALPEPVIVLAVVAGVVFLTEMTSNAATTATLLPILAAVAPGAWDRSGVLDRAGGDRGELCVHDAGGDAAECDCVWVGGDFDPADVSCGVGAECDFDRGDCGVGVWGCWVGVVVSWCESVRGWPGCVAIVVADTVSGGR